MLNVSLRVLLEAANFKVTMYTGKGDKGTTTLFKNSQRFSKTDEVFEALGSVDELNSFVGLCKVAATGITIDISGDSQPLTDLLHTTQENLFIIQAEIAGAEYTIAEDAITQCEEIIHNIQNALPPITTFLIPGGSELSARLDCARSLTRRVERSVLKANESVLVSANSKVYLNRLSSVFYALTRWVNHRNETGEKAPQYGRQA